MKGHATQNTRSVGGFYGANNASEILGQIVDVRGVDEIKASLFADAFADADISAAITIQGGALADGSDMADLTGAAFEDIERDDNLIVTVVDLVNDVAFTLAVQPNTPSRIVVVIVDTTPGIIAGTIEIAGTDPDGAVISESVDISGGAATYFTTAVFLTVTEIIGRDISVLGGASDETITVGVDNSGIAMTHQGRIEGSFAPAFVRFKKATGGTGTALIYGWFELTQHKEHAVKQPDGVDFDVDFVT